MTARRSWFCTLFDRNYLYRGVALYRSLERHAGDFTLVVLCMDDETYETLERLRLARVRLLRLGDFEDAELLRAKGNRSAIEYYWTCTPSLPLYVLEHEPDADVVTYLDSDLYFYSDPAPLFAEMETASVMIHEHRFAPRLAHYAENGIYNVGWVSFRNDERGLRVARRWREQCNEWCYYKAEDGRLGDQKYLDTWTQDFEGVHVMRHTGGGVAPWNVEQYTIHVARDAESRVMVDDTPLVFFHFHGMRLFDDDSVHRTNATYPLRDSDVALIYAPYEAALRDARREVAAVAPAFRHGLERRDAPSLKDELLAANQPATVYALIPVHNRLEYTRECLRCFARQDYRDLEVIVIDDGSTDGTAQAIATEFPRVTVMRGDGHLWWTGAMWRAVRRVLQGARPTDYVLCINNDTTFEPDYVSTLVKVSRAKGGALVGSLLRSWTDGALLSIGPKIDWWKAEVRDLASLTDDPEGLCRAETIDTLDALPGRGMLVPVKVFHRVGNFRRRLLPHYGADYEFAARAKRRGERLVLSTHAAVYTAPDAPRRDAPVTFGTAVRKLFSRRSSSNVFVQLAIFALCGPLRARPRGVRSVLRYALDSLREGVRTSMRERRTAGAGMHG
ncbi:MAG TPA: glycosyltransferase family 2 protein [Gemmatimonadaceae bacterium]|nr:glycosyltransferase family 2 protein [Gemmatimonadaceae bacterium]